MTFGRAPQFAQAYRQIAAQTAVTDASPHRLISMLYDGFIDALADARGALKEGDIGRKCAAAAKASRIVEEGLRAALDLKSGGRLASDLNDLYFYVNKRLTIANLRNDDTLFAECQRLMQPLRDAWHEMAAPAGRADA